MTSESRTQSLCRLRAASSGHKLLRNNSGALPDSSGRIIRYGLGNDSSAINSVYKSPDLIGWTTVTVQPHHVGKRVAIFTAIECKGSDWRGTPRNDRERAQAAFLQDVVGSGGVAGFVSSEEDYVALLDNLNG